MSSPTSVLASTLSNPNDTFALTDTMDRSCTKVLQDTHLFEAIVHDFQNEHDAAFSALKFSTKQDGSLVSNFEQGYEKKLCQWLQEQTPWSSFQGEEGTTYAAKSLETLGYPNMPSSYCWYCDPIDGTISFRNGLTTYGFTLTLARETTPIATLIYFPKLKQTFTAFRNGGAACNGAPLSLPVETTLADFRVVAHSDHDVFKTYQKGLLKQSLDALPGIKRTYTDIHGYTLTALGSCVGTLDAAGALWDLLPGLLLIQEAGGQSLFIPADTPTADHYGALVVGGKTFVDAFQKNLHLNKDFLGKTYLNGIPLMADGLK